MLCKSSAKSRYSFSRFTWMRLDYKYLVAQSKKGRYEGSAWSLLNQSKVVQRMHFEHETVSDLRIVLEAHTYILLMSLKIPYLKSLILLT
jgi:hypothetical protein